ncbi:MAG TPA: hypothetical protein VEQ60_12425 [Longimicrobium sp.]|nr:hypothetical protein [Longimicrobium sp.]
MPQIRIMTWNVRTFSFNRALVGPPGSKGTLVNIVAQVIQAAMAPAPVDVVLIVELSAGEARATMSALSTVLRGAYRADPWSGFLISYETGNECYGMLIRDLDTVRVVYPAAGPPGDKYSPLSNLEMNSFSIWPSADWAASAYPLRLEQGPGIPLIEDYASSAGGQTRFPGQPVALGGLAQGLGSRVPAMPILWIRGAHTSYMVPIVIMHLAAIQGNGNNALARGQIEHLRYLHIAQMFDSPAGAGYLAVGTAPGTVTAVPVQELLFTGDFNVDFLDNQGHGLVNAAYGTVTPMLAGGGSAAPAALPAAPGPVPAVPYAGPFDPGPPVDQIPPQQLRTAITAQGTILGVPQGPPAIPPAPFVTAAFDNFFYGGQQLTTAPPLFGADAGLAVNLPGAIQARQLDVSLLAAAYGGSPGYRVSDAPNLQGAGPISDDEARIGANLISDHLPVILQFDCP